MPNVSTLATMTGAKSKNSRGRTSGPDRGGIRKKGGPQRLDRDGDLEMDGSKGIGRGGRIRGRSDATRRMQTGPGRETTRHGEKDKTLNALQKAIFSNASSQINIRQGRSPQADGAPKDRKAVGQLRVRGWRNSKAASNPDGGIESLVSFLEKKSSPPVRISKSRVEGDALIVSVRPEQISWVLRINGYSFAGSTLSIEEYGASNGDKSKEDLSPSAVDTKAKMTAFLGKRYFAQTKVLDLSNLGSDQDLVAMGMFNSTSTESKFFPALMKVCEMNFDTPEKRKEAVTSVSLANNQLANVSSVTTLSQTFPELKNLDLSNNQIKDIRSLSGWRWKFRELDFLDLLGNPVSAEPTFKDTMLRWYPKLRTLNNTTVRTTGQIAAFKKTPIPVLGPVFHDESNIAENFVKAFFVGFDNDRNDLLNGIYDNSSTFSLNVNVQAPRGTHTESTASWDSYIKKSRNLLKIQHLSARMARSYVGVQSIREVWNLLPRTKHPDMVTNPRDWLVECHPIPGLPDFSGQSSTGVGGLLITAHGRFDELDMSGGGQVHARSFDRTFIIGPGGGFGGLRVVNDMLCLRAFGGSEAWIPESEQIPRPSAKPVEAPLAAPNLHVPGQPQRVHPEAKDGYGTATPGKTQDQLQKEQAVLETSFRTKMTLQFSEMALSGNNWNLEAALKNFEELKAQGQLPANAFLTGV